MSGEGGRTARAIARAVMIALVLFAVQGALLAPWVERERVVTRIAVEPVEGLEVPAEIKLLETALGSFRGALINVLWLRATSLQEEGRVHEAMQLAQWITRLQPYFPQVWSYQARNLSDNLSVTTTDPAERYEWVRAGIEMLRDQGIRYNRESKFLYRELAYVFWFKLGGESRDEYREYYWRRFAIEWDEILGEPQGDSAEARAAWLLPIAEAPATLDELIAAHPGLAEARDDYAIILADRRIDFLRAIREAQRSSTSSVEPDLAAFVTFLRAQVLRRDYSMDPWLMVDLTRELGPIDWRHAASHAAYWAACGILRVETHEAFPRFEPQYRDELEEDHIVSIALKQLIARGRMVGDPRGPYIREPDFRFIEAYERGILEGDPFTVTEVPEEHRFSYFQVLELGVERAWVRGDDETARSFLARLGRFFDEPGDDPREWLLAQFELELPEERADADLEIEDRILRQLYAMMEEGWTAQNELVATRRRELAESLWSRARLAGAELRPFDELVEHAIASYLRQLPLYVTARSKAAVWARMDAEQRAAVPEWLLEQLRDDARRSGLDPLEAFPATP